MTQDQITARLRECMVKQISVTHQFNALTKLYEAAAVMRNATLCETLRAQQHDLLDLNLDTINEVTMLTRMLIESGE